MRSRNSQKPPRLEPDGTCSEGCLRPVAKHHRELTRTPWQNADGWWKLTTSGRLWWAPLGARRWRLTPWFVADDQLWHSSNTTGPEETQSLLELLADGRQKQLNDRLERRAADARRRRALKPAHPPRRCCCCGCTFTPKRADARCCSGRCRAKLSRNKASDACCGTACS
ncbi:hypothetical protein [Synechococcus sp. BIOS-E4-1]|uniref:hypothetical protein n=1 Tax=Synechococcus sp. BIOS-E4-1 TaxID=1400864 RepID=UPI0016451EE4|nr:hypothetical protein [Synechococcus sp. BIOS-E4-1]